jgi:cysteine desulfurase / selenocysteine lyase
LPDLSRKSDASSAVPPVHPSAQPAAPKLSEPRKNSAVGRARAGFRRQLRVRRTALQRRYRPQGNRRTRKRRTESAARFARSRIACHAGILFFARRRCFRQIAAACQSYPKNAAPIPKFDIEGVRRDFPALHQLVNGKPLIWLDNAATTHKPQAVIDATSQFYRRDNSNIHRAAHALAARSTELFEAGREKVRKFLGAADAKEIVFVRGTTEAINLVAQSYGRKNIGAGDEIIVSELEHHANIVPWQLLAEQVGATSASFPSMTAAN